MGKHYFTKNIEKMVDPIDVGTIHFMQSYSEKTPVSFQNKMIQKGAEKNPYMGFVVEPYSFFLCYEIKDVDFAQQLLPNNYQLIKTAIIEGEEPKYYGIFGTFNVHSSAFWGTRMEFYIIAENKETGLLSWVIVDYDTNTISFDQKQGLIAGNTISCVFTTNFDGEIIVDIQGKENERKLIVEAQIKSSKEVLLCHRLWLEGNLSISYGRKLAGDEGHSFAVSFNPNEVKKAMQIPLENICLSENTWYPGLLEKNPSVSVYFPFAQHYLSDSPGHYSEIKNEEELVDFVENVDFSQFSNYSSQSIKKGFLVGNFLSLLTVFILTLIVILQWIF